MSDGAKIYNTCHILTKNNGPVRPPVAFFTQHPWHAFFNFVDDNPGLRAFARYLDHISFI
ncbi:hypothetical protein A3860_31030 [Niastella vici]|uniref:Uncharacterized protein n=1 Tax=Niastella vici TaxID=1703345 RepID=A0A1V9FTP8_9BACT|nr:hypothetical protein A3860_31030 [Niastella vici]